MLKNKTAILLLALIAKAPFAFAEEQILVEKITVSDQAMHVFGAMIPVNVAEEITGPKTSAYFYVSFSVLNPEHDKYKVDVECTSRSGKLIYHWVGESERSKIDENKQYKIGKLSQFVLGIEMSPDMSVKSEGQVAPFVDGEEYLVKTTVEGKLVGLTRFSYAAK